MTAYDNSQKQAKWMIDSTGNSFVHKHIFVDTAEI